MRGRQKIKFSNNSSVHFCGQLKLMMMIFSKKNDEAMGFYGRGSASLLARFNISQSDCSWCRFINHLNSLIIDFDGINKQPKPVIQLFLRRFTYDDHNHRQRWWISRFASTKSHVPTSLFLSSDVGGEEKIIRMRNIETNKKLNNMMNRTIKSSDLLRSLFLVIAKIFASTILKCDSCVHFSRLAWLKIRLKSAIFRQL